jgi:hypothetical protein
VAAGCIAIHIQVSVPETTSSIPSPDITHVNRSEACSRVVGEHIAEFLLDRVQSRRLLLPDHLLKLLPCLSSQHLLLQARIICALTPSTDIHRHVSWQCQSLARACRSIRQRVTRRSDLAALARAVGRRSAKRPLQQDKQAR